MICPKCSNEIPNNVTVCSVCGTAVNNTSSASEQQSFSFQNSAPQYATQQAPQLTPQFTNVNAPAPTSQKIETLLQQQKKILRTSRCLALFLLIAAIGIGYLAYVQYRQTHSSDSLDSSNRVLVLELNNDLTASNVSDERQIANALKNGGLIRLKADEVADSSLQPKIEKYSAMDSSGMYWVLGALLNYISSEGWELIQSPTTGLSQLYYFRKK